MIPATTSHLTQRARNWLARSDERLVAAAMFHLNHLVKNFAYRYERDAIYELKNRLVRRFYERGFCAEVGIHIQTLLCWDCGGTGKDEVYEDWIDESRTVSCYRCGGTGVIRELTYYHFLFEIRGRRYAWHQPDWAVDWPIQTVAHERAFEERESKRVVNKDRFLPLYMAIVRAYLDQENECE